MVIPHIDINTENCAQQSSSFVLKYSKGKRLAILQQPEYGSTYIRHSVYVHNNLANNLTSEHDGSATMIFLFHARL